MIIKFNTGGAFDADAQAEAMAKEAKSESPDIKSSYFSGNKPTPKAKNQPKTVSHKTNESEEVKAQAKPQKKSVSKPEPKKKTTLTRRNPDKAESSTAKYKPHQIEDTYDTLEQTKKDNEYERQARENTGPVQGDFLSNFIQKLYTYSSLFNAQ